MTTIYVPKTLNSEFTRFKDNQGNISIDYRSSTSGTKNILNTPYDPLNTNYIEANIAPLNVSGTHVSGDNNNFRTLTIDYLISNDKGVQSTFYVFLLRNGIKKVERIQTISQDTYFESTFKISNNGFIPIGSTNLQPLNLQVTDTKKLGYVDKLYCKTLELLPTPEVTDITINALRDEITIRTPKPPGNFLPGEIINSVNIPSYLKNISAFTYVEEGSLSTQGKLSIISKISSNNTTYNLPVLNSTYTNYGSYVLNNGGVLDNIFGYSFILKPDESVLCSQIIRDDLNTNTSNTLLASHSIGVSTSTQPDGASYFSCIRVTFPSTVPTVRLVTGTAEEPIVEDITVKFFTSINNNQYTSVAGYTENTKDDFITALKAILEPLDFYFFPRKNGYWFIYNYSNNKVSLRFAYRSWKLETEEDISTTQSIHNINTTVMANTVDYFNTSIGIVDELYLDKSPSSTEEIYKIRDELTTYGLDFSANPNRSTIDCMYNYITLTAEGIDFATQTCSFKYKIDDGTDKTVTLNYTASTVTTAADYFTLIQQTLQQEFNSHFTVEVDFPTKTITLKNKLSNPFKFYFSSVEPSINLISTYNGLYTILPGDVYFFIVSKGG